MEYTEQELANEEWRDVVGWGGLYQVSNLGRVKSLPKSVKFKDGRVRDYDNKILSPLHTSSGYLHVMLYANTCRKQYYIHRLVCEAFISNTSAHSDVNHIDGCKTNNRLCNLEWCSRSSNIKHAYDSNLRFAYMREAIKTISRPVLQYSADGELVAEYPSASAAARLNKYNQASISLHCRSEVKKITYKGFIWKYKEE